MVHSAIFGEDIKLKIPPPKEEELSVIVQLVMSAVEEVWQQIPPPRPEDVLLLMVQSVMFGED